MPIVKDVNWFKEQIAPLLKNYNLSYRFFEEGDFGSLNQVEFDSTKIGGNIDFWGLGWLGIFVWDFETEEQLFNVLIEPQQEEEKDIAFKRLNQLLQ